jgi:hypothetical protein
MTAKIRQKSQNVREELTALSFAGAEKKKIYLNNNLIDNGKFDNGTTGWYVSASGMATSVVNGEVNLTNTAGSGKGTSQGFKTEIGKTYKISATARVVSGNGAFLVATVANVQFSGNLGTDVTTSSSNTELSVTFTAVGEESYVYLRSDQSGVVIFDNVLAQELDDNMIVNGGFNYDGGWHKGAGWTISGGTASCDGSQTSNSSFTQRQSDLKGEIFEGKLYFCTFTISGYSGGGGVNPHLANKGYGNIYSGNGTYSIPMIAGGGTSDGLNFYVESNFVGSIDNVILSEGSHHVTQSLPKTLDVSRVFINGELAREGENYDYQIKTDGINQWLKPTVEPTATTETAVIGVYK